MYMYTFNEGSRFGLKGREPPTRRALRMDTAKVPEKEKGGNAPTISSLRRMQKLLDLGRPVDAQAWTGMQSMREEMAATTSP